LYNFNIFSNIRSKILGGMGMINIRRAKVEDANILTNIAINSEAYWGYDEEYMESYYGIM